MIRKSDWKFEEHIIVVSENTIAKEKLIKIWKEIDFEYKVLSETELLFRIKN